MFLSCRKQCGAALPETGLLISALIVTVVFSITLLGRNAEDSFFELAFHIGAQEEAQAYYDGGDRQSGAGETERGLGDGERQGTDYYGSQFNENENGRGSGGTNMWQEVGGGTNTWNAERGGVPGLGTSAADRDEEESVPDGFYEAPNNEGPSVGP